MSDYIMGFKHLYSKAKKIFMTLPDALLAYKFFEAAILFQQERQLALTTTNTLEYSGIKSVALKRMLGEQFTSSISSSVVKVKEEPVYLTSRSHHEQKYKPVKGTWRQ